MDYGKVYMRENEDMLTNCLGIKTKVTVEYNGFDYIASVALIFDKDINVLEDFHSPQMLLDHVYNQLSESSFIKDMVNVRVQEELKKQQEVK